MKLQASSTKDKAITRVISCLDDHCSTPLRRRVNDAGSCESGIGLIAGKTAVFRENENPVKLLPFGMGGGLIITDPLIHYRFSDHISNLMVLTCHFSFGCFTFAINLKTLLAYA